MTKGARPARAWRGRGRGDRSDERRRSMFDRYFIAICSVAFVLIVGCATYFVVEILV